MPTRRIDYKTDLQPFPALLTVDKASAVLHLGHTFRIVTSDHIRPCRDVAGGIDVRRGFREIGAILGQTLNSPSSTIEISQSVRCTDQTLACHRITNMHSVAVSMRMQFVKASSTKKSPHIFRRSISQKCKQLINHETKVLTNIYNIIAGLRVQSTSHDDPTYPHTIPFFKAIWYSHRVRFSGFVMKFQVEILQSWRPTQ
jgi:hypothetical protein